MGRKREENRPWVRWYLDTMTQLAASEWMTLTCWRVLACLLSGIRADGSTKVTQAIIHEQTGIRQPHISRALRVLIDEGLVDQVRRGTPYYLSTSYFYKGAQFQRPFVRLTEKNRTKIQGVAPDGKQEGT